MFNFVFNLFIFVFGLVIGSFLNALIYRLPRNIDIGLKRSSCPQCDKTIYWYENIPLMSFLFLKGKCSGCHKKISWQYPLVELICGTFALLASPNLHNGLSYNEIYSFLFYFFLFSAFLVHFIVDVKHQILPDSVNIFIALLLLTKVVFYYHWSYWVLGSAVGLAIPLTVTWIFYKLKGQVGLGGGDIKLFAVLGLYVGVSGIFQTIFLSCFLGAIAGGILIATKKMSKDTPMPFGPFILIVAFAQIFYPGFYRELTSNIFATW